jgi:hypothetical protein
MLRQEIVIGNVQVVLLFWPSVASYVLFHNQKFYLPTTMLDPTLQLQLNDVNENDCRFFFRFSHGEVKQLIVLLQLPEVLISPVHHDRVLVFLPSFISLILP